jgi:hypothetical protein
MTLAQFKEKYLGKKVDFDGVYGAQCVDLFRQYCKDVWELPHLGAVEGASELYTNFPNLLEDVYCNLFSYNEGHLPEPGDVCIWGPSQTNKYGHVAICLDANQKEIVVLEQNGFTQDGVKVATRYYPRLLGWLRKRA